MKLILLHTTSIFLLLASISNSKEINISSDELVIDRKNNISIFSGNVYAFEKNLEIWADQLTLKFNYEKNEVEEIYAEQNVKIARENIIATGNTGFYYPVNNEIKMLAGKCTVKCFLFFPSFKYLYSQITHQTNTIKIVKQSSNNDHKWTGRICALCL